MHQCHTHNAPFCNRNVHIRAYFCYKMMHCGIFVWCIVGFMRWVYCLKSGQQGCVLKVTSLLGSVDSAKVLISLNYAIHYQDYKPLNDPQIYHWHLTILLYYIQNGSIIYSVFIGIACPHWQSIIEGRPDIIQINRRVPMLICPLVLSARVLG